MLTTNRTSSRNEVTRRVPPSHTKLGLTPQCFSIARAAAWYTSLKGSCSHHFALTDTATRSVLREPRALISAPRYSVMLP